MISSTAALIASIAGIITSLTIIISSYAKIKSWAKKQIRKEIDLAIEEFRKEEREYIKELIDEKYSELKNDVGDINDIINSKEEKDVLRIGGLLELMRYYFVEIHKTVRITGNVEESDMNYLDTLFPIYKALGGNSDVEKKYNEIRKLYERRITERLDALNRLKEKEHNK